MGVAAEHGRIEVQGLTKRYGPVRAVSDVSFTVEPGQVTGFLGPNGAGKTTTLRMLLGLARPDSGRATIGGLAYADLPAPLRTVGAALDGSGANPGRTGRDHLRWVAAAGGVPASRCDEVLALTGLSDAARRKAGGYSMGMRQRLALATALLGDPGVLVLDEPANGLDPAGIAWLRGFLRTLASEGRTVLVSSHVLSEVEQTVDHVVVLAAGQVAYVGDLAGLAGPPGVLVDSLDRAALGEALAQAGLDPTADESGALLVRHDRTGAEVGPARVGAVAAAAGVALSHLSPSAARLEDAFLRTVTRAEHAQAQARAQAQAHSPAQAETEPTR